MSFCEGFMFVYVWSAEGVESIITYEGNTVMFIRNSQVDSW